MRRGFFGRGPDSPRTSSTSDGGGGGAGGGADAAEEEEGLDTPKNRRRLPKQARARAPRARRAACVCAAAPARRGGGKSPFFWKGKKPLEKHRQRGACARACCADAPRACTRPATASCCTRTSPLRR
jgi:hypothetical protein